jgi:hypothetical protein
MEAQKVPETCSLYTEFKRHIAGDFIALLIALCFQLHMVA